MMRLGAVLFVAALFGADARLWNSGVASGTDMAAQTGPRTGQPERAVAILKVPFLLTLV